MQDLKPRSAAPWVQIALLFGAVLVLFTAGVLTPGGLLLFLAVFILPVPYFIPAIVGRKKQNANAIFILNLFLGWSFLGWVAALIWACTKDPGTGGAAERRIAELEATNAALRARVAELETAHAPPKIDGYTPG